MMTAHHAKRVLLLALTTLVAVGAFSGSASGRTAGVQFIAGNSRVVQGNEMTLTVSVAPRGLTLLARRSVQERRQAAWAADGHCL